MLKLLVALFTLTVALNSQAMEVRDYNMGNMTECKKIENALYNSPDYGIKHFYSGLYSEQQETVEYIMGNGYMGFVMLFAGSNKVVLTSCRTTQGKVIIMSKEEWFQAQFNEAQARIKKQQTNQQQAQTLLKGYGL